jgi:hypothetical protein
VAIGAHSVNELAGTGSNLNDYTAVISGDCAANGSITLVAGDNKTCTITNTRKARLTVNKVIVPPSDTGLFNLQIDGSTAGTGANQGNGGTTGIVTLATLGLHSVGETAGTGSNLSNYTVAFSGDCATNGSITLAAGDNKICTITNTRKQQSTLKFGLVSITGTTTDHCDANSPMGTRYVSGGQGGTAISMSVYVPSPLDVAPYNRFQLALYSDNAGNPGTLIATTGTGVLVANSWNTLSITAPISPNTAYWLFYNSNGRSCSVNNLKYISDAINDETPSAWQNNVPMGTWPVIFAPSGISEVKATIYLTYVTGN